MAVGAFWFAIMGLLVKIAGKSLPSQQIVLMRAVFTLAMSWWALERAGIRPRLGNGRPCSASVTLW